MSAHQAFRDAEARLMNPTHLEGYPDEPCDLATPANSWPGELHCLDDHAWYLPGPSTPAGYEITRQRKYICSGCLREMAQRHFRPADEGGCPDSCLGDPWTEAEAAIRCDACGYWKCRCRE
jgi:hypothetical protein